MGEEFNDDGGGGGGVGGFVVMRWYLVQRLVNKGHLDMGVGGWCGLDVGCGEGWKE